MDIRLVQDSIKKSVKITEDVFTFLGNSFPKLLSIVSATGDNSLSNIQLIFNRIQEGTASSYDETSFFDAYNKKNQDLFEQLSAQLLSLDSINDRVSLIRYDSEELEIISLNAMVISIKSGEKGRAFSCITENLKKLSTRMIALSNELIVYEQNLLQKNDDLKKTFNALTEVQNHVARTSAFSNTEELTKAISTASFELQELAKKAQKIKKPVQDSMVGIQMQDIIRQSTDQVIIVLDEITRLQPSKVIEERLDQVTMILELGSVCKQIISDILKFIDSSVSVFTTTWKKVPEIFAELDRDRENFITLYLDTEKQKDGSFSYILNDIDRAFAEYLAHLSMYQQGQKAMVRDSLVIVKEVKHLQSLFDTIIPIISRLQHVRITQQIEVAKNSAIGSVKDTVDHMSDLIMQADDRVKETRKELDVFIKTIDVLTRGYSESSEADNRIIDTIKQEKVTFFNTMKDYKNELLEAIQSLQIYPPSFKTLCTEIDSKLKKIVEVRQIFEQTIEDLDTYLALIQTEKKSLLIDKQISSWSIQNDYLRKLVNRFTITEHKAIAGRIGGFEVEQRALDEIESGDVTLFF